MEIRNRERDAPPFVTKDGSTIREYLATDRQSLAEATLAPRGATTRHYHALSEEIYTILEGGGHMEIDGETSEVEAGDTVLIPPGSRHRLTAGSEGALFLCCCSPPYADGDTYLD